MRRRAAEAQSTPPAALESSNNITTDKLVSALDFSKPGAPSSRDVYISQVDQSSPGGLKQVQALKEGKDAKTYTAPHESVGGTR